MSATNVAKNEAVRFALAMGKAPARRHFASGGGITDPILTGPFLGVGGGRTDSKAISVPPGSFVLPADCVSGIPGAQSNSLAGHSALQKLFSSLPLSPDEAPYGAQDPTLARARTIPGLGTQHHLMANELDKAKGGRVDQHTGEPIPIAAADGEFVVHPIYVKRLGLGNLERGHRILDAFVEEIRKQNIKTLKKLPGTVRDGTK
jgi:hypothetical protein